MKNNDEGKVEQIIKIRLGGRINVGVLIPTIYADGDYVIKSDTIETDNETILQADGVTTSITMSSMDMVRVVVRRGEIISLTKETPA